MATREHAYAETNEHLFTRALTRAYAVNWEMVAYATLLVLAILTRFVDLGARVMSHDESLHTYYSWRLYKFGEFNHTPLMHGPLLFHMTALNYFLFGDNDFTARIYPALLGVMIVVLFPWLFRRWLGRVGAVITSVLLLISPMVMYYNRYIREDTPEVFFVLVMVYAIMQYIDGEQPRRQIWIWVLSAGTFGLLASKEVSFMYAAIFFSFLGLYLIIRYVQEIGVRQRPPAEENWQPPAFQLLVGHGLLFVFAAISAVVLSEFLRFLLSSSLWIPPSKLFITVVFLILYLPLVASGLIRTSLAGQPSDGAAGLIMRGFGNGQTAFRIIIIGAIIGAILALWMAGVLDIIKPTDVWKPNTVQSAYDEQFSGSDGTKEFAYGITFDGTMFVRQVTWVGIPILLILFVLFLSAVFTFPGSIPLPWREMLLIILVASITLGALMIFERRSYVKEETDDQPFAAQVTTTNGQEEDGYEAWPIIASWVAGVLITLAVAATRYFTNWWNFLNRQPVFDVLVIIATLVLPWAAAFPLYWAGYELDNYSWGTPRAQDMLEAASATVLPFLMVSMAIGVAWNWKRWAAAAVIFYALFAFFFTTVFSNSYGLATGMIGSLGYWLEQQGVRRGSQPQYYYLLTQLPVYEFLPMLGSLLAGVAGLVSFWQSRRARALAEHNQFQIDSELWEEGYTPEPVSVRSGFDLPDQYVQPYDHDAELERRSLDWEWLGAAPFLALTGWWAILITLALTLAGEKMPWLTLHMTVPMILLTGWWLGRVIESVRWESLRNGGWLALLVVIPLWLGALAHVILAPFGVEGPFQGQDATMLANTGSWLAAILLVAGTGYVLGRFVMRIGWLQVGRMAILSGMAILAILTVRSAFMACFTNYDYATEFLVYAHSGPAVKTTLGQVDELAELTNEGNDMRIVFDDESSWPFTWYLRNYQNYGYIAGEAGSVDSSQLEGARVVIVGSKKAGDVRRILGDRFYEFDYIRLWWPMQEYFYLTYERIAHVFDLDDTNVAAEYYRQGLYDIWIDRDYVTYAVAMCLDSRQDRCSVQNQIVPEGEQQLTQEQCQRAIIRECTNEENENPRFSVNNWPVSDRLYVFIDKSLAAQIWDAGIGSTTVDIREPSYPEDQVYQDIAASDFLGETAGLSNPRGIAVGPDGLVYVADTDNNRVVVLDQADTIVQIIGTQPGGMADPGSLRQPWGLDVTSDGTIYVADTWNHRIQVFNASGELLRYWGHEGVVSGGDTSTDGFWGPRDVKVGLDGNVYVADTGNKRVRVYTSEGEFLFDIGAGTGGALQGQLDEPVGLAFNPLSGDLYVAEPWNTRIQSFNAASGQSLSMWSVNMWFNNRNSYNRPYLAISPDGQRIYTVDMDERSRVVAYTMIGVPLLSFDQPDMLDTGTLGLRAPAGLDFDAQGRLYVVDSDQARIFVFPAAEIGSGVGQPTGNEQPSVGQGFPPGSDILQAGSSNGLWSPIVQDVNGRTMAYVPSGCFKAGVPRLDGTLPEVCLNSYWIGVTEVTNAAYAECVAAEACTPPSNRQDYDDPAYGDHPVVFVTWEQAQHYAAWVGGTLPSEAQWEYAARGPEGVFYPWGEDEPTCDFAVLDGCDGLAPVGTHPDGVAWVGAFDMAGNAWEWTSDFFDPAYYDSLSDGIFDPTAAAVDMTRTVRGGSWADAAENLLSTSRAGRNPSSRFGTVGFRVVVPAIQNANPAQG